MKKTRLLAALLCLALLLPAFPGLAASKKKAAAQPRELSLWVNREMEGITLDSRSGVTVSLTKAALNKENVTLYFQLQGGKKNGSVKMTGVTVGGKTVKADRKKNVLDGYIYSDNGTVGLNLRNPQLLDVQFSLQLAPKKGVKAYTVGPFRLHFEGDFTQTDTVTQISLYALERGERVTLIDRDGVLLKLSSFATKVSRFNQGEDYVMHGTIEYSADRNIGLTMENVQINGQACSGDAMALGNVSGETRTGLVTLTLSAGYGQTLPPADQIQSASFSLRVRADAEDLMYEAFQLTP